MKYCSKCGREIDDGFSVCDECAAGRISEEEPRIEMSSFTAKAPSPDLIKRLATIIAAALFLIGAVIACIIFLTPDPDDVVDEAYANTLDLFDEIFSKAENLDTMFLIMGDFADSDKLAMALDIDIDDLEPFDLDGTADELSISADFKIDSEREIVSGAFSMSDNVRSDLNVLFSANSKSFIFRMPDRLDGTYGVAIDENIIDRFIDSRIYRNGSLPNLLPAMALRMMSVELKSGSALSGTSADDASSEEFIDTFKKLKDSFSYEKDDRDIPMFDDLRTYRVDYDNKAMAKAVKLLISAVESSGDIDEEVYDFLMDAVDIADDGKLGIYLGINDDSYMTAASLCANDEYLSLILDGKGNVWDSFSLYADSDPLLKGGFKQTSNGFNLRIVDMGGSGLALAYNDRACKLTFTIIDADFGEIKLPLYFDIHDDARGISFELELDELGFTYAFSIADTDVDVEMLDTDFADILDFDEAAYERFMLAIADTDLAAAISGEGQSGLIYENVFDDPDIEYYD